MLKYGDETWETGSLFRTSFANLQVTWSSDFGFDGNCLPGHENPIFQFSPIVSPVQYAQVEIPTQRQVVDLPSPTDPSNPGKAKLNYLI